MRGDPKIPIAWYAVSDYLTASLAWALFFFIRRGLLHQPVTTDGQLQTDSRFWMGIFLIPLGWLILYTVAGSYHSLYKKSRLFEFTSTFICSLLGSTVLFFVLLIDDVQNDYSYYYLAFLILFGLHFLITFSGRWVILNTVKKQLHRGRVRF
ncbi:MAG: hypothetical protein ACO25B_13860, partial [Chitinophagaceae bacterium]